VTLVGIDTDGTTETGWDNGGEAGADERQITAIATGSASEAHVRCRKAIAGGDVFVKVLVFGSDGTRLAISNSSAALGDTLAWVTCTFASPPTITSGQTYGVAVCVSSYRVGIAVDSSTTNVKLLAGSYTFADPSGATWTGGMDKTWGLPSVHLDGTAGGGQFARPVSDVSVGDWTASSGTDRFAMVDEEAASDADDITSGATPSNDECVLALGAISTPAAGTVTLRVRMKYV